MSVSRFESKRSAFRVRISLADRAKLDEAAKINQQTITEFVRLAVLNAMEECMERPPDKGVVQRSSIH